jgi:hypothetical protein
MLNAHTFPREITWKTLSRSRNPEALSLLGDLLATAAPELRARTLEILRNHPGGSAMHVIARNWNQLTESEQELFNDRRVEVSDAAVSMLASQDRAAQTVALHIVRQLELTSLTPQLVDLACNRQSPVQHLAGTCLQALCEMWGQRARADEDRPSVRTPMLNCLSQALERFPDHHAVSVVDAWLMLVTAEDQLQRSLVSNPHHPAFDIVLQRLRYSPQQPVMQLLASYIWRRTATSSILRIIEQRPEREFALELAQQLRSGTLRASFRRLRELPPLPSLESYRDPNPRYESSTDPRIWSVLAANTRELRVTLPIAVRFATAGSLQGRRTAAQMLKQCPPLSARAAVDALLDTTSAAAGTESFSQTVGTIVSWLNSPSTFLKRASREYFAECNLPTLFECARTWSRRSLRCLARIVLLIDPAATEEMLMQLTSPSPQRRLQAVQALDLFETLPQVYPQLLPLVHDPQLPVRLAAIKALSRIGAPELVPLLPGLLAEPTTDIQDAAQHALRRMQRSHPLPAYPLGNAATAHTVDA